MRRTQARTEYPRRLEAERALAARVRTLAGRWTNTAKGERWALGRFLGGMTPRLDEYLALDDAGVGAMPEAA